MSIQAFVGAIVQRGIESAIDNVFSGQDNRGAGRQPFLEAISPAASNAFGPENTVQNTLLEQFVKDDTARPSVRPNFIDDPLLAKLASGEAVEPTDFLRL